MSKKWILRTLALLVIVGISTVAIVRHQHQQQKVASAQIKKDKKEKAKSDPDKDTADEPVPAAPAKMEPKATVLGPAAKGHLAEQAFISALREVFLWRSRQPVSPETNRVLLEKLSTITSEDLPPDQKSAWQSLLQSWKDSGDPAKAMDPQLKVKSERAAETLNAMFKVHGDGDIVL